MEVLKTHIIPSTTHPLIILKAELLPEWIEGIVWCPFQREYPKEVFHKLCSLYKDRKIVQKIICIIGHVNEKKFNFE